MIQAARRTSMLRTGNWYVIPSYAMSRSRLDPLSRLTLASLVVLYI